MDIGRIGIWKSRRHGADAVPEIEALGFGALWLGGSPSVEQCREYLERGTTLPVISGILNIWQHDPADVAAAHDAVTARLPGPLVARDRRRPPGGHERLPPPAEAMRDVLRRPRRRRPPVRATSACAAALGPKMLDLAKERSLGAHPYFVPVEHTRFARERLGEGPLLAPEVAVVVETDPETRAGEGPRVRPVLPPAEQLRQQPAALRLHGATTSPTPGATA